MKISWTPTARKTYFKVIAYLEESWTKREIQNFVNEVESILREIKKDPYMFEASRRRKNVRKGFITKHNTLYYRVKPGKQEIELITFWDNRQDPNKLAYWKD
jgi:plasmid stabilization system protein ParE